MNVELGWQFRASGLGAIEQLERVDDSAIPLREQRLDPLGDTVGRKRIRRLMAKMGLVPICQRPRTTVPHPEHRVYPYLLRDLAIAGPTKSGVQTYIPMRRGFLYLGMRQCRSLLCGIVLDMFALDPHTHPA
jgi:hypothetical protein